LLDGFPLMEFVLVLVISIFIFMKRFNVVGEMEFVSLEEFVQGKPCSVQDFPGTILKAC
jgi:hypothetical protein